MPIPITEKLLIKLAGKASFRRGKNYYEEGAVLEWTKKGKVITARVEGSRVYHVRLEITDRMLDGSCDCPASDNFDFCKHCVSVALAYEHQLNKMEALSQGSSRDQIQAYLLTLDKTALEKQLLDIITEDSHLERKWLLKSKIGLGRLDSRELKKTITKALPYQQLWGYRQVNTYFGQADSLLDEVIEHINKLDSAEALKLLDYAYQRLNKALDHIDDSGGARYYIESLLHESVVSHFKRVSWSDKKKADYLLNKMLKSYSVYPSIPEDFIEANSTITDLLIDAAGRLWESWPPLDENNKMDKYDYWPVKHLLLEHAEKQNDLEKQIAIRAKVADGYLDFMRLCELNREHGDIAQAYAWLDRAEKVKQFSHGVGLDSLRVSLLKIEGKYKAAQTLQWRIFIKTQDHADYQQLREIYQHLKIPVQECYQQSEAFLIDQLNRETSKYSMLPSNAAINFYMSENQMDKAIVIAQKYKTHGSQLIDLAKNIISKHPAVAFEFYQRVILKTVEPADKRAYEYAISLLKQLQSSLDQLSDGKWQTEFDRIVELVRTQQKRKPSLMKMLDKNFS